MAGIAGIVIFGFTGAIIEFFVVIAIIGIAVSMTVQG